MILIVQLYFVIYICHGVQDALKQFIKHFVPTTSPNVADILYAVDQVVTNLPKEDGQKRKIKPTEDPSTRMVVVHQLDSTLTQQHDIEALMEEVRHLKEENLQLTAEVAELKRVFGTPGSSPPTPLHTLHHASRVDEDTTVTQANDIIAQAINTLPKTLENFWKQMKVTISSASFHKFLRITSESPELKHAIQNEKKYLNTYQTFQGAQKSV